MKIAFVLPAFFGTGGINVVYEYSKRLTDLGHDVVVYAPIYAYNMHREGMAMNIAKQIYATLKTLKWVHIDHIPEKISNEKSVDIKVVWEVCNRYIRDNDVVIATAWCTAFDVSKLNVRKGKKIYFIQGLEVWDNEELGRQSYRLPLKKITIAKWIKDILVEEYGCDESDIDVVNNGIDCEKYNIEKKDYEHSGDIRCLMLDHSLPLKGVQYGVEAFQKAKEINPHLSLSMFGMKKSNNVPADVHYYLNPSQEELIGLYRESDIFIFPSLGEGWGLTPIEAMACKCAVVGSNVASMMDIGINGENAILCEPQDVESITKGILILSNDIQLRKKISECGYDTVQALDWDNSVIKLERILLNSL